MTATSFDFVYEATLVLAVGRLHLPVVDYVLVAIFRAR